MRRSDSFSLDCQTGGGENRLNDFSSEYFSPGYRDSFFAMVASKPQFRSLFVTPVCVHFHPLAQEANTELRPLILERGELGGETLDNFESWSGVQGQTLFRMLRDLADSLTAARSGARVSISWQISAKAEIREKGSYREIAATPGAFWSGIYYVDDGYHKSDDETLGGEYELADPRGVLPVMFAPQYSYRLPGSGAAGFRETIRPQSGMILLYPSWLPCGEKRFDGADKRVVVAFDMIPG